MQESTLDKMLLRPIEVAHALAIGKTKTYELIANGKLPSIRIGGSVRVPADALREWIRQQSG